MQIMTTNAFVDRKVVVGANTLVILDEAHNITSGTVAVMNTVPHDNLVRVTATPPDEGYPLDFATPLPSRIEFRSFSNWELCEYYREHAGTMLVVKATVNDCLSTIEYIKASLNLEPIFATGDGIYRGKEQISFSQLERLSMDDCVIVSTDVLQESVTLGVTSVWDEAKRVRPATDVAKRLRSDEPLEDQNWMPDRLIVDATWPEIGQIAGRVGRIPRSSGALCVVNVTRDLDRTPYYVSEKRDKLPRDPKTLVSSKDIVRFRKFKRELARKCTTDQASRFDRKNNAALEFIEIPDVFYDTFTSANLVVQKMFAAHVETPQPLAKFAAAEEEVCQRSQQFQDDLDVIEETQKATVNVIDPKDVPLPFRKLRERSEHQQGFFESGFKHRFIKKANIKFDFGSITAKEMRKISNMRKAGTGKAENGFCYLELLGYRQRTQARKLGPNVRLDELARKFALKTTKRLVFTTQHVAHVADADEHSIRSQLAYLSHIGKRVLVGNDDFDECEELEDDYFAEEEEEEVPMKEIPENAVTIKGSGDCWKRMGYQFVNAVQAKGLDEMNLMVEDFLEIADEIRRDVEEYGQAEMPWIPLVKFSKMESGDWHIEETHFMNSRAYFTHREQVQEQFGGSFYEDFIQALKDGDKVKVLVSDNTGALNNAINSITSATVREAVDNAVSNDIIDEIGRMRNVCPYKIPDESVSYFNTLGIPHLSDSPRGHSHPVHYAIRRNKIVNVLPKYLTADFTTINMKAAHVQELEMSSGRVATQVNVLRNAKDFSRFGENLANSPFEIPQIETPIVVLDQMAHFMTAGDILAIGHKNPKILTFIAGHEFPVPALFSSASPLPHLWQHRVEGKTLFYKCETDESEPYQQPFDPSLLLARTIRSKDSSEIWYCQVVHSHLNSHTQIITRIPITGVDFLQVQMHDFIELMPVHRNMYVSDLVPRTLFDRMMDYAQTMNGLKHTERRAKLRQLLNPDKFWIDENTKEQLVVVVDTLVSRSPSGRENVDKYYDSFGGKVSYNTIGRVSKWLDSHFHRKYIRRWKALTRAEHPLKLIPLVDLKQESLSDGSIVKFKWEVDPVHAVSFWYAFRGVIRRYLKPTDFDKLRQNDAVDNIDALTREMSEITLNQKNRRKFSDEHFKIGWTKAVRRLYGLPDLEVAEEPQILPERRYDNEKDLPDIPMPTYDWDDCFGDHHAINPSQVSSAVGYYDRDLSSASSEEFAEYADSDDDDDISDSISIRMFKERCRQNSKGKKKVMEIETESEQEIIVGKALVTRKTKDDILMREALEREENEKQARAQAEVEAESLVHTSPIPTGEIYKTPDEAANDGEDNPELFKRIVKAGKFDFTPIRNEKPWEFWWDEKFPLTSGKRYKKVPYVPVRKQIPYPEEDCLLVAFASLYRALVGKKISPAAVWAVCCHFLPKGEVDTVDQGLSDRMFDGLAVRFNFNLALHVDGRVIHAGVNEGPMWKMTYKDRHWEEFASIPPLVISPDLQYSPYQSREATELVERLKENPLINFKQFKPDTASADRYLFHLIHKRVGTFHNSPVNDERLLAWDHTMKAQIRLEETKPKERYIAVVVGDPGCGKSKPVADVLKNPKYHRLGVFQVALPVGELRDDWAEKIGVRSKKGVGNRPSNQAMCCTFEYALAKTTSGTVLIVDEDKFPTGYIGLMCLLKPSIKYVIFLGDPFQGSWHDPGKNAGALNEMQGEMERYVRYADYYVIGTKRFGANMGSILSTPTVYEALAGGIRFAKRLPVVWTDLKEIYPGIPDETLKEWWSNQAALEASHASVEASAINNRNEVMTMASSQGLTKDLVILHINQTVITWVGPDILWVAMSRAHRVVVYWSVVDAGKIANLVVSNPSLSVLNYYRAATPDGRSAQFDPTKIIDFRRQQGGLNPNWKLVLAFPPDECKNWQQVQHLFPKLHGYLDHGEFRHLGGAKVYRDIDHNDEGHQGHPHMAYRTRGYRLLVDKEAVVREPTLPVVKLRTKLPKGDEKMYSEYVNAQVADRFAREIWSNKYGYSIQAPEGWKLRRDWKEIFDAQKELKNVTFNRSKIARVLKENMDKLPRSENPMYYSESIRNWGLVQTNSDEVSYAAMMVERVRRSTYVANRMELRDEAPYGDYLWESWRRYCGWSSKAKWSADQFEKCQAIFTARRAARSEAMKKMALARADPDFTPIIIAKTQFKLKSTDIKAASALQTTLTMEDEYLFKFGAIGVYMLEKLLEILPGYVYIHAKKKFSDTAEFVSKFYDGAYWESDLKQQEQSMRGGFLQFFLRLMSHLNIPEEYIDSLREMKLNTVVGRMTLALMTASGEIFTWIYNTFGNGARIAAKYNLNPGDALMLTGDDSLAARKLLVRDTWKYFEMYDHATEKSSFSNERGTFAGYVVKKRMIFKNPEILLRKFMVAAAVGKMKDVIHGYFLEWATIYALGDELFGVLTEIEMEAHNILSNKIFNARREYAVNAKFGWDKVVALEYTDLPDLSVHQGLLDAPQLMQEMTVPMTTAEYFADDEP
ncbi:MAG: replicase [Bramyrmic virus 1]|nr:MAG: replicase [Bramyrmic virus 1]